MVSCRDPCSVEPAAALVSYFSVKWAVTRKRSIRGHVFIIDLIRCVRACNIPLTLRRVLQKQHNKSEVGIAWCLTCLVLRFHRLSFVCMEIK
jgi:hypothetical protein